MSSLSELQPSGGGGTVIEKVASGALSNGDKVIVNSDGTVSVVEGNTLSQSIGSAVSTGANYSINPDYRSMAYDPDNSRVVVAWNQTNGTPTRNGYAVVGTISGTSISFGTPVVWVVEPEDQYMTFLPDDGKILIIFKDTQNSNYITSIVGTVSGTSISFGTKVVIHSTYVTYPRVIWDPSNGKVVAVWLNGTVGQGKVGTVSGTSTTWGSIGQTENYVTPTFINLTYDQVEEKILMSYVYNYSGNYIRARVLSVSGTTLTFGSENGTIANTNNSELSAAYDEVSGKHVLTYRNYSSSNYAYYVVLTVSGTSYTYGTPTSFNSSASYDFGLTYDPFSRKLSLAYRDGGAGAGNYAKYRTGTVSGTTVTWSSATTMDSNNDTSFLTIAASTDNKVVVLYRDNTANDTRVIVIQNAGNETNLTASNYIGIADGAYSDGATATIQAFGSVDDAQTGLTAGQAYYIQYDGSLGTTADYPEVFAGTAVGSTKLIIGG